MKKCLIILLFILLSTQTLFASETDKDSIQYKKEKEYSTFYSVKENNKNGILMKNGDFLILPTTEKINVIAYMDCCPIIEFRNKFYYIDKNYSVYEVLNYKAGDLFYIIKKDGKYGLLNHKGENNIILEPIYDYMEILRPYWISRDYDTLKYTIMMWVKIRKGVWYGYYDCATNKLSEFKYKDLRVVRKGKFRKSQGLVHYYLQKKTNLGWQYETGKFYKELPKRLWEDTILYYGLFGFAWDSIP